MKHKLLKFICLLGMLLVSLSPVQKVKADVDYDIAKNITSAKVNPDGSLSMKRAITYQFNSRAHGVYYRQALNSNQKIEDVKVQVKNENQKRQTVNNYVLKKMKRGYRFKVFYPIKNHSHFTVTYFYRITNAITNYRDIAELNFKIIGNGWDTDLDYVKASVIFARPVKGLKAWAHGPLDGYLKVNPKKGKIVMIAENLAGDTGIEVHTIFPVSITAKNKNVKNKNHRQAVIKQEKELAQATIRNKQKKERRSIWLIALSLFVGLLGIIKGFRTKAVGFKPRKSRELAHNYEIPDVDPILAQILDTAKKPDNKAFTAYLISLAAKKKIKIADFKVHRKTYYQITLLDKGILDNDILIKTLFNSVGDGNQFTTQELKKYHGKKLGNSFDTWATNYFDSKEKQVYLPDTLTNSRSKVIGIIILTMAVSFASAVIALTSSLKYLLIIVFGEALILLLSLLALVYSNKKIGIYSEKGKNETEKIRGFKKMLRDIGKFKMKDVGDLILWEDIMPYAVSFGLADKVMKEMKIEFSEEEIQNSNYFYYGFISNTGKDSFSSNFDSCFSDGISSGSSSFSSGSSGGFGGGSGGGAF